MSCRNEAEALILREARYLDLSDWDAWLGLYTEDCEYWVPTAPDQTDPNHQVSLFYEDRILMETRIRRLRHPAAHSLVEPIRTSHVISGIIVEEASDANGDLTASSSFLMLEQHGERQRLFGGLQTHRLRREQDGLRIRAKRVDLTSCDATHEVIEVFI
jgi:3-phenylpropionate/cinnamic acid dioxygenase small subunit